MFVSKFPPQEFINSWRDYDNSVRILPQSQRASPPRQLEFALPTQAEFVICDCTIEAGIKEGKTVFQMHHLKVRSPQALLLQEYFACFAANFVRFAGLWLSEQQIHEPPFDTGSVKQMVQVCAHTSAWVQRFGDVWLLTFTEQSRFAGYSLRIGSGAFQLPLPLYRDIHF